MVTGLMTGSWVGSDPMILEMTKGDGELEIMRAV
jgi:hypothetical protein